MMRFKNHNLLAIGSLLVAISLLISHFDQEYSGRGERAAVRFAEGGQSLDPEFVESQSLMNSKNLAQGYSQSPGVLSGAKKLTEAKQGEVFPLVLLNPLRDDLENVDVLVTKIRRDAELTQVRGKIDDRGHMIATIGPERTFVFVATPEGSYSFSGREFAGYLELSRSQGLSDDVVKTQKVIEEKASLSSSAFNLRNVAQSE